MSNYVKKRIRIEPEEVLEQIPHCHGQIEPIERALNCTRMAVFKCFERNPEVRQEFEDEKQRMVDRVVDQLYQDSVSEDVKIRTRSRELFLKAMARDRGFGEKIELSGANGPLVMLHTVAKIPTMEQWTAKATIYTENENKAIDAQIAQIGMGDNQQTIDVTEQTESEKVE